MTAAKRVAKAAKKAKATTKRATYMSEAVETPTSTRQRGAASATPTARTRAQASMNATRAARGGQ